MILYVTHNKTITTTLSDSPYLPNEYLSDEYSSFESDAILFGDSVEFDITNRIDEPELIDVEELENHLESRSTRRGGRRDPNKRPNPIGIAARSEINDTLTSYFDDDLG